jgi:hypothetical protein
MKKLFGICAAALLLAAAPASAADTRMVANLSGGEEAPTQVLTGAFGTATVTIDSVAQRVTVDLTVYNLPTGSTAGHIHAGPRGVAGPVVLDFTFPPGRTGDFAIQFRLSTADFRARPEIGIATMADALQAIIAGNAYVNIHTSAFPGGEIRGQLVNGN